MNAEFDLEWFCVELVGMTTRPWLMESVGIASTSVGVVDGVDRPPPLFSFVREHPIADVTIGAIRLLGAAGLVTGRSWPRL